MRPRRPTPARSSRGWRAKRWPPAAARTAGCGVLRVLDARAAPSRASGALRRRARAATAPLATTLERFPEEQDVELPLEAEAGVGRDVRDGQRPLAGAVDAARCRGRRPQPPDSEIWPGLRPGPAVGGPTKEGDVRLGYQAKRLRDVAGACGKKARRGRAMAARADRAPSARGSTRSCATPSRSPRSTGSASAAGRPWSGRASALPALYKTTMMERFDEVVTDRRLRRDELLEHLETLGRDELYLGRHRVMTTSGSSAPRGLFVYDREAWRGICAMFFRHTAMAGIRPRLPRLRMAMIGGRRPHAHDRPRRRHPPGGAAPGAPPRGDDADSAPRPGAQRLPARLRLQLPVGRRALADEQLAGRLPCAAAIRRRASCGRRR